MVWGYVPRLSYSGARAASAADCDVHARPPAGAASGSAVAGRSMSVLLACLACVASLARQGVGTHVEVDGLARGALPRFHMERRARRGRGPEAAALPGAFRI